jgi:hypothetical protein
MNAPERPIRVKVDPTNPGQFFACCGLLELADRLWSGAEGWFDDGRFCLAPTDAPDDPRTLRLLLAAVQGAQLEQLDRDDDYSSPIRLGEPFHLTLDWWKDEPTGGNRLKVWAGSMRSVRIARAMQAALARPHVQSEGLFDCGLVVFDPNEPDKKVEPYYFDGRRGSNAQSLDIGFAPDAFQMTTAAYPAVEFFCLVGLQRCRPRPTGKFDGVFEDKTKLVGLQRCRPRPTDTPRVFDYYTWPIPCRPEVLPAVICGLFSIPGAQGYRFENAFRTDQKKHKAFLPANPLGGLS